MTGDGSGLTCAEAFAQHFHAGFKVVQGAGAHPGVPVADEVVGIADQLQQLTAVMFAKFGGGQLQVEQADVRQFGQIDGEQRAVGADFIVIIAKTTQVDFAVVAELFEEEADALAIGTAAVLRRVVAQGSEVCHCPRQQLFADARWFGGRLGAVAVQVNRPQPG